LYRPARRQAAAQQRPLSGAAHKGQRRLVAQGAQQLKLGILQLQ
jgi:hypothetical protein